VRARQAPRAERVAEVATTARRRRRSTSEPGSDRVERRPGVLGHDVDQALAQRRQHQLARTEAELALDLHALVLERLRVDLGDQLALGEVERRHHDAGPCDRSRPLVAALHMRQHEEHRCGQPLPPHGPSIATDPGWTHHVTRCRDTDPDVRCDQRATRARRASRRRSPARSATRRASTAPLLVAVALLSVAVDRRRTSGITT
jgi:hypothetical protein